MFEVGFSELCMVGLVALLVIGPEKLPKIARLAGFWLGKSRAIIANVKAEITEELRTEEMRQILNDQQSKLSEFREILHNKTDSMQSSVQGVEELAEKWVQEMHEPK